MGLSKSQLFSCWRYTLAGAECSSAIRMKRLVASAGSGLIRRVAAYAHYFTMGIRLHHTWKTGHLPFALTRPNRVHCRYGSRVRLPGLRQWNYSHPRLVGYLSNEQLQGKLLSAYKISQAYPGAPRLRYACSLSDTASQNAAEIREG